MSRSRAVACGGEVEVAANAPKVPSSFGKRQMLESVLGLGEYVPYPTHRKGRDFMFRLAVQKRILGKPVEAREMLDEARSYLASWKGCVDGHEGVEGSICYERAFRELLRGSFARADELLAELDGLAGGGLGDFHRASGFAEMWNRLQRILRDTFYAHLAYYPAWLADGGNCEEERINCADCRQHDKIAPPVPAFIMFSAFFMPREARLADGSDVPEGVLLHEKAGEYHELHEHAHAYVHEKKRAGVRPACEWIDEGIADWAAITAIKSESKDASLFHEMYDFWRVVAAMTSYERAELVRAWCIEPETYDWEALVDEASAMLARAREETRGAGMEKMDIERYRIDLARYRIIPA